MFIAYINMDEKFENVLSYSTSGGQIKVNQEDPVIDISKLAGYRLKLTDDQYYLVWDQAKWDKIKADIAREEAIKEANAMVEEMSTQAVLLAASDEDAYKMRYLYEEWKPKTDYKQGDRRLYKDNLYKCKQNHTSEEGPNRTPDYLPALWDLNGEDSQGSIDNPVPIPEPFSSMEYVKGKYYQEGEDLYLMNREGMKDGETVTLTFKPSQLVGQYFKKISKVAE